jgi:hypothetical protein
MKTEKKKHANILIVKNVGEYYKALLTVHFVLQQGALSIFSNEYCST